MKSKVASKFYIEVPYMHTRQMYNRQRQVPTFKGIFKTLLKTSNMIAINISPLNTT